MHDAFSRRIGHLAISSAAAAVAAGTAAHLAQRSRRQRHAPSLCATSSVAPATSIYNPWVTNWADTKKVAALEANYQTQEVVAQRQEMLSMLGLQPGERVLDVGCGPGFLMLDMVKAVGDAGHVEGTDPSEAMRVRAAARLAGQTNAVVRDARAEELPFPDMFFDAVVMSQVLLYVQDVPRALQEAYRVLRPGGRLLTCDTDWDNLIVHTQDKARLRRIIEVCSSTFVDGHLPPKLPGLLRAAGFRDFDVRTVPMIGAGKAEAAGGESSFMSNWAFQVVPEKAKGLGWPDSEIDSWLQEQRLLNERGEFFACVHRFLFLARKPKP